MTQGIFALLVLLLTVALVASRSPSQSDSTRHRLTKSGKKSKGKKASPIDDKHNGKKGGKKGKKGEYDEHWEEVFFSPMSKHEPTMPYSPTGGIPFAPATPSYEFAPNIPITRTSVPAKATLAPFPSIPNMGMGPSFAPILLTSVPILATAVPDPQIPATSRPTIGSILPTAAPFPSIAVTLSTANVVLSDNDGSFGRTRAETTRPPAKQSDLAASPSVATTSPVSEPSAPVLSPAVAPGSAPFVAPNFAGEPITSPRASNLEPPLIDPVVEAPEAPLLSPLVVPSGRDATLQPFAHSTVLASRNAPILETPIDPMVPFANSRSAPVASLQPFASAPFVESTAEPLKPVSNPTFRDSGPSVTASTPTQEPPSDAPVQSERLVTVHPLTSSPGSSQPISFSPTTVSPTSSKPSPHSQMSSVQITASPTAKGNPSSDGEQVYRREYISSTITLVLEGDIDLAKEQAKLFQSTEQQMQYYLVDVFGSVMEDFELSITFRYTDSDTDGRRLQGEVVNADVAVILSLVDTDPVLVRNKSQEDIDKAVRGFFERNSLQKLMESMKESGVHVSALSTTFLDGEISTTKQGTKALFVGALTGGLAVIGIAVTFFYKRRRCRNDLDEADPGTLAAVCSKSDPFESHPVPDTMMIVSFEDSRKYQDALLDAADADAPSARNKDIGFKMIDGPDLVASTPGLDSWNGMWDVDCRSTAESTAYSRSDFLDDRPRPEYDSRQPGQRFRPWNSGTTNPRKPIKQSRLMRPFQPTETQDRNDNKSIASESSMQPLVSRSRKTANPKPKPESLAPTPDVEGEE